MSHLDIQEPFHCRVVQCGLPIPNPPLGLTNPSSRIDPQSVAWLQDQPQIVCLGATPWIVQFQSHPYRTPRHARASAQKTKHPPNLGTACSGWLVSGSCIRLIPMLHSMDPGHPSAAHMQHLNLDPRSDHHANGIICRLHHSRHS